VEAAVVVLVILRIVLAEVGLVPEDFVLVPALA
jgi:hypothetical protein